MNYAHVEIKTEHDNLMESNDHSPSIDNDEEIKSKDFQDHKSIKEETPNVNLCRRKKHKNNSMDLENEPKSPIKWTTIRTNEQMWKDRENKSVGLINNNRHVLIVNNWPVYWSFSSIKEIIDKEYGFINKIEMATDNEECFEGAIRLRFDSLSECKRALECLHGKEVDGHTLSADLVEDPVASNKNPANSVENPDHSMEKPDNSVIKRSDSAEKSNHFEEDASDESSTDNYSSEPQAKRRRLTEEPWRPDIDVWEKDPAGLYGLKPTFLKSLGISTPIDEWVHVTNFRCDKLELIEVMELAGQVITCTIVARKQTYAKVRFSHPLEAVQAVSMLNNKLFYGQPLKVLMDQCPSDRVILPKGLESVGPGLGETGTPLRDIVRQYERYVKGRTTSVNTNIFRNPDERLFSFDTQQADISVRSKEIVENQGFSNQNRTLDCNISNSSNQTRARLDSSTSTEGLSQSLTTQINPQNSVGKEQASESWSRPENPATAGPSGNWSIGVTSNNHGTMLGNSGPFPGNSPISSNSGPMSSNCGPIFSNSGPISSNSGPIFSTSTPAHGNNTLLPSNNRPILGNPGTVAGNTGPVPPYTGSMPNNQPMPGNTGPMPYNTGCISNIGSNTEYTVPMDPRTRNMSGFAGSVPHTRAMTGNTGLGLGYTGHLLGQNVPQTVNTGTMHGYTGNIPGYTGSMTGNTGPVQGQINTPGYSGLMSGNSAPFQGYTGNMPRCTVSLPNPGNFNSNIGTTPCHNPNFGNTGPMPRPTHGPAGPNFANTGSTHGLRMLNPSHNMTYTGGPNGPNGSHPGCASRPNQETPTDLLRPESSANRPPTESPKQKVSEDYITLEISNLPLSTSFPVLCEKMSECGQVMSLQLTGPGCAILQYATRSQAERCFQMYNKFRVLDNIIDVRFL